MDKKRSTWIKGLLAVILVVSVAMSVYNGVQTKQREEAYEKARAEAMQTQEPETTEAPETTVAEETTEAPAVEMVEVEEWHEVAIEGDTYLEELKKTNLESLREINEDVLGWIAIPGTKLDYPLMRGDDNEYYLEHDWERNPNIGGSVFMEQFNSADFSDFNTVIYGHRMKDDSIFGSLKYYSDQDYWEQHPYIYIYDDMGAHRYEVFASYEGSLELSTYQVGFADDASKQTFLENCAGYSVIETGVMPEIDDRIITLSTCTGRGYDTRWVVQARKMGEMVTKMEPKTESED